MIDDLWSVAMRNVENERREKSIIDGRSSIIGCLPLASDPPSAL
jgi:hypothetical protein